MGRGASQVEVSGSATGKSRVEDNDSVVPGVGPVVPREGSVTTQARWSNVGETDGIDVECAGGSPSESFLHGGLLRVLHGETGTDIWTGIVEPGWVVCPGDALQPEAETSSRIVSIQDTDLGRDLGISAAMIGIKRPGRESGKQLTKRNLRRWCWWRRQRGSRPV